VANTRDNQDRRDRKEAALREQWAAALACTTTWAWLCGSCVVALGAALIGVDVMVWWHDDAVSYRGESMCVIIQYTVDVEMLLLG